MLPWRSVVASTRICTVCAVAQPAARRMNSRADPLVRAGRPRPAQAGQGAGRGPGGPPHIFDPHQFISFYFLVSTPLGAAGAGVAAAAGVAAGTIVAER